VAGKTGGPLDRRAALLCGRKNHPPPSPKRKRHTASKRYCRNNSLSGHPFKAVSAIENFFSQKVFSIEAFKRNGVSERGAVLLNVTSQFRSTDSCLGIAQ